LAVLAVEIDAITVVSRVIDGDTFDTTSEGRIRLADVNAPENGEVDIMMLNSVWKI
jgi:endonuclease YncB( thermonuclease family)